MGVEAKVAYTVAITGNAASGKSAVGAVWREMGIPVIDADRLSRQAVARGTPGLDAVRLAFGDEMIAGDGALDRARMREVAFRDPGAKARLEGIVHPIVLREMEIWIKRRSEAGERLVACEIPLLFELGIEGRFDRVVLVDARPDERHRRIVERSGLTGAEAGRMMSAQGDPVAKRPLADAVIDNDATEAELRRAALRTIAETKHAAGLPLRLDLHLHTWDSFDSLSDPDAVLDRAIEVGVDRIAITDHDRLRTALQLADRHPSLVIAGEEIKTAEGVDVIGLYLHDEIPRGISATEAIRLIHDQGGVAYLPHPYAPGKGGGGRMAEELGPLCDVIEVFNGRIHQAGRQDAAADLRRRLDKAAGAGSDAHTIAEVGGAWTETVPHESTPSSLLNALVDGRVVGRMASRLVHLGSTWAKVRKAYRRGPWTDREVVRAKGGSREVPGSEPGRPLRGGVAR